MLYVLDAICGSGKSSAIFNQIKKNPNKKYIYVTPFLSEVNQRVPLELPNMDFNSPSNLLTTKMKDLKVLIQSGVNISCTHVLFSLLTVEIMEEIIESQYVLIIDEAVNCIGQIPKEFKVSDTEALLGGGFVIPQEGTRNQLVWNEEKFPNHDGKYRKIRNMCNMGMLYSYGGMFLMWEYPPKLMKELKEIYVLTYLFSGSDMKGWLEVNNVPYKYLNPQEVGLKSEKDIKALIRENLTIEDNRTLKLLRQSKTSLSASWFRNSDAATIKKYKGMIRSFVVKNKIKSDNLFWTTYKNQAKFLAGDGYSRGTSKIPLTEGVSPCFLPCNIRATNDYKDRQYCVYAMNRYKNPIEATYLLQQKAQVSEDDFALGEMIQFMFRGAIRENKPMTILILSKRMRGLLEEWLKE